MTAARLREIRRIAHDRAARELEAVIDHEMAERLFTADEDRAEFEAEILRICARLRKRAAAS